MGDLIIPKLLNLEQPPTPRRFFKWGKRKPAKFSYTLQLNNSDENIAIKKFDTSLYFCDFADFKNVDALVKNTAEQTKTQVRRNLKTGENPKSTYSLKESKSIIFDKCTVEKKKVFLESYHKIEVISDLTPAFNRQLVENIYETYGKGNNGELETLLQADVSEIRGFLSALRRGESTISIKESEVSDDRTRLNVEGNYDLPLEGCLNVSEFLEKLGVNDSVKLETTMHIYSVPTLSRSVDIRDIYTFDNPESKSMFSEVSIKASINLVDSITSEGNNITIKFKSYGAPERIAALHEFIDNTSSSYSYNPYKVEDLVVKNIEEKGELTYIIEGKIDGRVDGSMRGIFLRGSVHGEVSGNNYNTVKLPLQVIEFQNGTNRTKKLLHIGLFNRNVGEKLSVNHNTSFFYSSEDLFKDAYPNIKIINAPKLDFKVDGYVKRIS